MCNLSDKLRFIKGVFRKEGDREREGDSGRMRARGCCSTGIEEREQVESEDESEERSERRIIRD